MKIEIKNLGVIHEGEVDLSKGLTIFTGPNSSGKSYMSYLIYGVYDYINSDSKKQLLAEEIAKNLSTSDRKKIQELALTNLLSDSNFYKKIKGKVLQCLNQATKDEKAEIFGKSIEKWDWNIKSSNQQISGDFGKTDFKDLGSVILSVAGIVLLILAEKEMNQLDLNRKINSLFSIDYMKFSFPNRFFMPAERTALTMVAKEIQKEKASKLDEIARRLQSGKNLDEIKNRIKPRYPLAIADYISWVNDLHLITEKKGAFAELADEIEKLMLGGKIATDPFGDIYFKPRNSTEKLDLHLSSSLVKSLSSLILYLRHQAKEGDSIIIDEPELNLHPDSQILVAQALAKIVNAGFKLIISTHSDFIIKEFNNLIMLNKAKKDEVFVKSFSYSSDMLLDKKNISAYFFNENRVKKIPIQKTGVSVSSMNKAIDSIDEKMELIYHTIFEKDGETV